MFLWNEILNFTQQPLLQNMYDLFYDVFIVVDSNHSMCKDGVNWVYSHVCTKI